MPDSTFGPVSLRQLTDEELELISGGENITVTYRRDDPYFPPPNDEIDYTDWDTRDGPGDEQDPPPPTDEDAVEVKIQLDRPLTELEKESINKLIQWVEHMRGELARLPADAMFKLADGQFVTVSQLQQLFAKADFVIVERNTENNGGVGAANYNNGDPIFTIDIYNLVGYMQTDPSKTAYLLHELAHVTPPGVASNDRMYDPNSPGGTTRTTDEFNANEKLANDLARAIADALGIPIGNLWGGYSDTNPFTYDDGTNDGGGTGGTGGTGGGGGGWGGEYDTQIP